MTQPMHRSHRVAGALVGSAVGDALGAPFEFGPPGRFSARFPSPARGAHTEMCGGGSLGWEPGEFTDDTQMALLVATSLVERGRAGRGRPVRPVPHLGCGRARRTSATRRAPSSAPAGRGTSPRPSTSPGPATRPATAR